MHLKFQLALFCDDNNLREQRNSILRSASLKIQKGIIKALNRYVFKLQKHKNILRNKMVDLLNDKQYKEIMTTIKNKVNIFINKLRKKKKQKKFLLDKVPNNQETGKKNRRYSQEKQKSKIRQNKKEKSVKRKSFQKSKRIYRTKTLSVVRSVYIFMAKLKVV